MQLRNFKYFLAAIGCLVAFGASATSPATWWNDNPWADPDRGFNWYPPDPVDEVKPEEKKPPEEKPITIYQMTKMEDIKKELDRLKNEAVINPSEKNVLIFLQANNWMMDKASLFADTARRVVWGNPDVNYAARSPTANFALTKVNDRMQVKRQEVLKNLSETHGILFFARSDCAFCHDMAPVLKSFSQNTGLPILAVSLDGRPIPMFPDAKPDNGIAMMASGGNGIQTVPALFLVDRKTQQMIPLGVGVMAADDLSERIRVLTTTTPGQEF
jgi:conjugal transfer pilus assembly protein TraF